MVGSGVWVKAFLEIAKKNKWILLSATPGDTWLDYIPVFIANGYYSNRTEFMQEHVVFSRFAKYPKVERILGSGTLASHLSEILVDMPYQKHTTRKEIDVFAEYDRDLFDTVWKRRWNYLEERPIRQVSELFSLMRRVVNTDPSRLARIKDLLVEHPKMIVFYNFDYELEILRTLAEREESWNPEIPSRQSGNGVIGGSSGSSIATAEERGSISTTPQILGSFAVAEWNGHKHEPIPDTDSWVYLVQYKAGSEGWNCIETDTIVFYSPSYSYRAFEQAKGRIDRLNTPFDVTLFFILMTRSVIEVSIFKALEQKRNFNESAALGQMER